jgi:hypothetical protein
MSKYKQLQSPKPTAPGAAPTGAGTVLRPAAAPATGAAIKDTLKGMNPAAATAPAPAPVAAAKGLPLDTPEDIQNTQKAELDHPGNDENFFSALIANPNTALPVKQEALDKFRAYVASPPADQSLTLPQVFARKDELKKKLSAAEEEVKFQPERDKFNAAWDTSKAGVDGIVERTAKKLGVSKQNLINSLVAGDKIDIPGRDNGRGGISIPQLLAEQWKEELPDEFDQPHHIWSTEARPLTPFKNSPFATKLGTKVGPIPIRQTWGDVLDAYVAELGKKKPSATPAAPPAAPSGAVKTSSGNTGVLIKSTR